MHSTKVVQSKVYVHNLVLILVYCIIITRLNHCASALLHLSLYPSPHLGLEFKVVNAFICGEISYFYRKISSSDLLLIQLFTYDVLIPFLKGYEKEHHKNYQYVREYHNQAHTRFFER